MTKMKVIAKRGTETVALAAQDADPSDQRLQVMLQDTETGKKTGPFLWYSLLARGYWEPVVDTNLLSDPAATLDEID
jgi:hypothetical protein